MSAGIEELCVRRDDLQKQIVDEEEEKKKLENDLHALTDRLSRVNESLCRKLTARYEFDKTIIETEAAYTKVCLFICVGVYWLLCLFYVCGYAYTKV